MGWIVYGKTYYLDSELTDTSVSQSMKFDYAAILKAVRVWLIYFNDPTFTSLNMKIYEDLDGVPGELLHTSVNSQLKADVISEDYGVKETWFEFANVNLGKNRYYHFVLNAVGYSGASPGSHIAWKNTYPDRYFDVGSEPATPAQYPLSIYPIFARFDEP